MLIHHQLKKTVLLFHDESTFCANEDQNFMWGTKEQRIKSRGSGIMVSDFVDEFGGFLALTDVQFEEAKKASTGILNPYARAFLEYGEAIGHVIGLWHR